MQAEFGMSWCAGFGSEFWSAYRELIPRAQGQTCWLQLYLLIDFKSLLRSQLKPATNMSAVHNLFHRV
jgi:hypothetical protein